MLPQHEVNIDFKRLLTELSDLGVTDQLILRRCKVGKDSLDLIRQGTEPPYSTGYRLLELWISKKMPNFYPQ